MKRKTPLVIVSNTMETTCPEFQTHAPLTCFFAFCFGSSASPIHACLGTLGGKVHCSLIIWCIYVFTAFSSLSFNHLSLTYSCLLLGNIYWAPVCARHRCFRDEAYPCWSRYDGRLIRMKEKYHNVIKSRKGSDRYVFWELRDHRERDSYWEQRWGWGWVVSKGG